METANSHNNPVRRACAILAARDPSARSDDKGQTAAARVCEVRREAIVRWCSHGWIPKSRPLVRLHLATGVPVAELAGL